MGAQRCVTQRVRKRAGSVTSRGLKPLVPKKSRVWSKAFTAMTRPRRTSMETIRAGPSRPMATCLADGVGGTSTPSKVLSRCIVRRIFPRQRQSYGLIP